MAAHPTPEQVKAHEDFRKEFERLYYTADQKKAAKKAAAPSDK
jgi:hypothetical protein